MSGGTMAVALGIYEQLLAAITTVGTDALKALLRPRELLSIVHWRFLLSLVCGVGLGIGVMVKVIGLPQMVAHDSPTRVHVYALFFGMVLASTVVLARHLEKWRASLATAVLVGAGLGFAIVNLVPVATPEHPAFIFFAGSIAICAMLLPGISGSFILLILGKYAYVLNALSHLQLSVIIPFSLGCLCGLLLDDATPFREHACRHLRGFFGVGHGPMRVGELTLGIAFIDIDLGQRRAAFRLGVGDFLAP
ncbi:MAG: DUF368 domain-containing protein, partial [Polyangiaceae bacterium]